MTASYFNRYRALHGIAAPQTKLRLGSGDGLDGLPPCPGWF